MLFSGPDSHCNKGFIAAMVTAQAQASQSPTIEGHREGRPSPPGPTLTKELWTMDNF